MTLAPWRSPLARALHRNRSKPSARYVQLATVRPDGSPANRTIVFRGFVPEQFCQGSHLQSTLQFVTDRRSEKVVDIERQALAEACWYFPRTREQFRLPGRLTLITEDSTDTPDQPFLRLRSNLWKAMSDSARTQFAWPHPAQERAESAAFLLEPPDDALPLKSFAVLLLEPHAVDHLELRAEPQARMRYWLDDAGQWQATPMNP